MSITIRNATVADAYNFSYVVCESWKAAYKDIVTPEEMKKNTDIEKRTSVFEKRITSASETDQFLIAYDEGKPCGICWTRQSCDEKMEGYGEVVAIYTLPECWGKCVGKRLIDSAIEGLKSQGFTKVSLWAFEGNSRARQFYTKYGFNFDGTYKHSEFTDTNEVRYRLDLV